MASDFIGDRNADATGGRRLVLLGYEACQKLESKDAPDLSRWFARRGRVHDDHCRYEALAGTDHSKHVDRARSLSRDFQRAGEPSPGRLKADSGRASLSCDDGLWNVWMPWNWFRLVASVALGLLAWLASLGNESMAQTHGLSGIGILPVIFSWHRLPACVPYFSPLESRESYERRGASVSLLWRVASNASGEAVMSRLTLHRQTTVERLPSRPD